MIDNPALPWNLPDTQAGLSFEYIVGSQGVLQLGGSCTGLLTVGPAKVFISDICHCSGILFCM